jgi:hypothetical protein
VNACQHRLVDTRDRYLAFATFEASGSSPVYEALAAAVAQSTVLLELLDALPSKKRQPNLLLAAARLVGAPLDDSHGFVDFAVSRWTEVSAIIRERSTQTNEAARTATFLPLLAAIEGPIALIEVGCSAGLCLYPDKYSISYDGEPPLANGSPVLIEVATSGPVPLPTRLPEVVARIGVDLNPIDISSAEDRTWLEALIWPEHRQRVQRLRAAATIVADEPPTLIAGDLVDTIDDALSLVPAGAVPVVYHSAVLNYLKPAERRTFADRLRRHPQVIWLANEGPGVVDSITTEAEPPDGARSKAYFILSHGTTKALAISDPHGTWLRWTDEKPGSSDNPPRATR